MWFRLTPYREHAAVIAGEKTALLLSLVGTMMLLDGNTMITDLKILIFTL